MSVLGTSTRLPFDGSDRPDAPLGTLLFRAGLVPEDKLRQALDDSISQGRRLGEVLLERGMIEERELLRILAGQKGLPFLDLAEQNIDPEAVPFLREENARLWGALAIGFENGVPVVAVSDPGNRHTFGKITEALGRKPRFVVAVPSLLQEAIPAAYAGLSAQASPSLFRSSGDETAFPAEDHTQPVRVLVRLADGERLELLSTVDPDRALAEARNFIRGLQEREPGEWPFVAGRFLRPDTLVSIDIAPEN